MRIATRTCLGALCLFSMMAPQIVAETSLVPVIYHPYPDDADPLGVRYYEQGGRGWDYFGPTYSHLDTARDGFAFPSLVIDGIDLIEGTPGGFFESTLEAYRQGWLDRRALEAPLALRVVTDTLQTALNATVTVEAEMLMAERGLRLHWVIAEDDVFYKPPPSISNGVFVHRFTARQIGPLPWPIVDLSDVATATITFQAPLDPAWDRGALQLAVWVQNHDDTSSRFAFGEVLQATMHPLSEARETTQSSRGVLLEMYSATWCAACLFGDAAMDALATENGMPSASYAPLPWRYFRPFAPFPAIMGSAIALMAAPVLVSGRGRGS